METTEFDRIFPDETACRAYLYRLRWPGGYACPRCGGEKCWPLGESLYQCAACDYQASLTAGTTLQDLRKPLDVWFRAVWWFAQTERASARGLQRALGLGSYQTAWTWLQKLRVALASGAHAPLTGEVEAACVDGLLGIEEEGAPGLDEEPGLMCAVESWDGALGRMACALVEDRSAACVQGFVQEAVREGAVVATPNHIAYLGLNELGYEHRPSISRDGGESLTEALPALGEAAAGLDGWLRRTHRGAVSAELLHLYAAEYAFRHNAGISKAEPQTRFAMLLRHCLGCGPATYDVLTGRDEA